jgi:hypothetical protein
VRGITVIEIPAPVYWQDPFRAIATKQNLTEFIVLDITTSGAPRGKVLHHRTRPRVHLSLGL